MSLYNYEGYFGVLYRLKIIPWKYNFLCSISRRLEVSPNRIQDGWDSPMGKSAILQNSKCFATPLLIITVSLFFFTFLEEGKVTPTKHTYDCAFHSNSHCGVSGVLWNSSGGKWTSMCRNYDKHRLIFTRRARRGQLSSWPFILLLIPKA